MWSKTDHQSDLNESRSPADTLAVALRSRWITQRCRRLWGNWISMAAMSPGAPSETTSSGALRPRELSPERKSP
jgi:hypothetical protein